MSGSRPSSGDVAIRCESLWKSYRNYHQRTHTLKEKILAKRSRYEEFWVLRGVDLEVPTGSTIGIVGGNGSGKSTLLKTVAGILSPNRGTVEVRGRLSSLLELGIGFHPELTGRENVYLSCSIMGFTKRDTARRFDEIVEFSGIEKFIDMPVKNYSTGMWARLAFAVAVTVDPEILLVDEVLSVGDEGFQHRCHERIEKFRAEGRTIVIVTHNLDFIRAVCDQAVWLEGGVVGEAGDPDEVVTAYAREAHSHGGPDHPADQPAEPDTGSRQVEVAGVVLTDPALEAVTEVASGDPLLVRVHCTSSLPSARVRCAVILYWSDTQLQLSAQTSEALELGRSGVIQLAVDRVPLLVTTYSLAVILLDADTMEPFHAYEHRTFFTVVENPRLTPQAGFVRLDGTWSVGA